MYKSAVDTEIHTVLAELAAELTRGGGSPTAVSFDIGVLKDIRQKMIACFEDDSKDEDSKKRWKEYDEWCNGLLDVRTKENEIETVKAAKKAALNERLIQLAERKRVAQHAAAGASPIKVKREGEVAVSPRRFIS